MGTELILHHYDGSPYSEKIRLLLGYKGLDWRSATMPPMLPKPELMTLTGGYRRAPVLQIGADVYCDSALIAAEIERRHPAPGDEVAVMPRGYPREAVHGRLVRLDADRVTLSRDTPETGLLHIHFPRLGYTVEASTRTASI